MPGDGTHRRVLEGADVGNFSYVKLVELMLYIFSQQLRSCRAGQFS